MIWNYFAKICCVVLITTHLTDCRIYNIEDDAIALYGEHFYEVLRRFRRTPDYLRILQERYQTMERHFNEITVQVMQSIETRISHRVDEMIHNKPGMASAPTTTITPDGQQAFFRAKNGRRQESEEHEEHERDPIVHLDGYYLLHQMTTTKERNDFRQLGFDMARQMVQLIIKGMGPGGEITAEHYNTRPDLIRKDKTSTIKPSNGNGENGHVPPGNGDNGGTGEPPPAAGRSKN